LASVGKDALSKTVEYMEKMAEFKQNATSDEDKQRWIDDYKKAMEPQDQLPLLFQTMTVTPPLAIAQCRLGARYRGSVPVRGTYALPLGLRHDAQTCLLAVWRECKLNTKMTSLRDRSL
jgi:hypothetical protein